MSNDGSRALVVLTSIGRERFWYDMFYETILYFTIIYVIPFPALIAMTYTLMRSLKTIKDKRDQMSSQTKGHSRREEGDLTRTMIAVVVVYIICQTPNPIRRGLLGIVHPSQTKCGYFYYYYHPLSTCILIINSAVNFILYYVYGRRFRLTFHARVRKLLHMPPRVEPMSSSVMSSSLTGTKNRTVDETV